MALIQTAVLIVAALGLAMIVWTSLRLADARHTQDSVLSGRRFSWAEKHEIRQAVQRLGQLPTNPALQEPALSWAREEVLHGPTAHRWIAWLGVATALLLTVLDLIPGAGWVTLVALIQVVVIAWGFSAASYARRGLVNANALLAQRIADIES
jgi:hypothetical protein